MTRIHIIICLAASFTCSCLVTYSYKKIIDDLFSKDKTNI